MMDGEPFYPHWCRETMGASSEIHQFSLWPLRSAPGSLGTYGFLTPPYGLPCGLELKNNPRLCTSLRVYGSNTPQEAAILIYAAARRQSENCRAPKAKMTIAVGNQRRLTSAATAAIEYPAAAGSATGF